MTDRAAQRPAEPADQSSEAVVQAGLRLLWAVIVLVLALAFISQFGPLSSTELLFPQLVGLPLLGLSVVVVAWEAVGFWRVTRGRIPVDARPSRRGLTGFGLGIAYVALLPFLGFTIDSVALIIGGPLVLGFPLRRAWIVIILAVVTVAIVGFVFKVSGSTPLPRGIL